MARFISIVICLFALASCGRGGQVDEASVGTQTADETQTAAPGTPEAAYEVACAGCHEDGKDGAPRTRHPEDWEGRSELWQSVLFEHAKSGYLDMPAKGGDEAMSEGVVAEAAQYMLELTYSNMPPDN